MIVSLQFPYTDVRAFDSNATRRLLVPTWRKPEPETHFVRSVGTVRKQTDESVSDWPGEEYFCDARRLIRFVGADPSTKRRRAFFDAPITLQPSGRTLKPYCAFRRLKVSEPATLRVEIGIGMRVMRKWETPVSGENLLSLLNHILALQVKSGRSENGNQSGTQPLYDWAAKLAKVYLAATTARKPAPAEEQPKWWVSARTPLIVIEYDPETEFYDFPSKVQVIDAAARDDVRLGYLRIRAGTRPARDVGVWLIGAGKSANRDYVKRLRIQLLRLHAEQQTITAVFQLLSSGKLVVAKRDEHSEELQQFFDESIKLLQPKKGFGVPQSEILLAAQQYEEMVEPGQQASLLAALSDIRPNLLRNISRYAERMTSDGVGQNIFYVERMTMNQQNLNITGSTIHGDVNQIAAKTIQDSFKRIQSGGGKDELKQELEALHKAVQEMLPKLPAEQQATVAEDVKMLTDQALSEQPRRKWYDVSAEGILEAVKFVGEMASPVKTALARIAPLVFA